MVNVTFWGVRGSTPCFCDANRRYGGNTSCVTLEAPGLDPVIFDLGTGLRFYGESILGSPEPFRGLALVTHMHWDHVQGLPFFTPIHMPGSSLQVQGRSEGCSVDRAFRTFMCPPFFPVGPEALAGDITFSDFPAEGLTWGRASITAADVPHTGPTYGYRVEVDGLVVCYVSDHQEPADPSYIAPSVVELCRDADLLIHDAQYEPHELAVKADWGHCTVDYAVRVAAASGARRLALFHHDPAHGDDTIDRLLVESRAMAAGTSVREVLAAHEGLTVSLSSALV
ncbi:MAG: MBL fold metallo-hydrolase [Acidimicrobiales bacterium]|nr:MBL fold metallo-hydrolase [Acidimicrobiales bacterium]